MTEMFPKQKEKAVLYKYMFLISTVCGALGIYLVFIKNIIMIGWILISIWFVLAVLVRIFILIDKKHINKNKKN